MYTTLSADAVAMRMLATVVMAVTLSTSSSAMTTLVIRSLLPLLACLFFRLTHSVNQVIGDAAVLDL